MTRRSARLAGYLLGGVLLLSAGAVLYFRTFQLPAPTGPYPVGTALLDLSDPARRDPYSPAPNSRRELMVQLWYPAAPSHNVLAPYQRWRETRPSAIYASLIKTHSRLQAPVAVGAKPFPVLLFSHRWNGARTQDTALAEDLASHGYVVAAIDYTHNAARVELANGTVLRGSEALEGPKGDAATAAERISFWDRTLQLWAADQRFVLDQLAIRAADSTNPFYSRLDTAHAGAFGHSFGGAAALALCGLDPRIQAAINLDGWTFDALAHRTAAQPIMLVYEGSSRDREQQLATLKQPGTEEDQLDRADFTSTEASLRRDGGYRLFVAGTQHLDFSDAPLLPPLHRFGYTGPTAPAEVNAILRETVLQFFDQALRGRPESILTPGQQVFPELSVEKWTVPGVSAPVTSGAAAFAQGQQQGQHDSRK